MNQDTKKAEAIIKAKEYDQGRFKDDFGCAKTQFTLRQKEQKESDNAE